MMLMQLLGAVVLGVLGLAAYHFHMEPIDTFLMCAAACLVNRDFK